MKRLFSIIIVGIMIITGFSAMGIVYANDDNYIEILVGYDGVNYDSKTPKYNGNNGYGYYDRVFLDVDTSHDFLYIRIASYIDKGEVLNSSDIKLSFQNSNGIFNVELDSNKTAKIPMKLFNAPRDDYDFVTIQGKSFHSQVIMKPGPTASGELLDFSPYVGNYYDNYDNKITIDSEGKCIIQDLEINTSQPIEIEHIIDKLGNAKLFNRFRLYSMSSVFMFQYDNLNKCLIYKETTNGQTPDYLIPGTVFKKHIPITNLSLNLTELNLELQDSVQLTATLMPSDATINFIQWSSSNPLIASVDNTGKVTAVAEGTATITATAGDKSATCTVTVKNLEIHVEPPVVPKKPTVDVPTIDTTTPPKEVIVGVQDKASQKIISDTVNSILGDITSGKDISKDVMSEKTLQAVKEALAAGKTVSPKVNAKTVDVKSVDKTIVSQVNELVKKLMKTNNTKATVAQYLDLGVLLMADSSELGSVNQLDKPIEFTVGLPTELAKAGRVFYIVRIHNGVAEKLATKMNSNKTLTFETDKFSSYAIVYEDGIVKTSDDTNILPLITMLGFGMFVGIRNLFKLEDE